MFLIWDDDNCVYFYASAESAIEAIEAVDVAMIKAAFDEDARPYRVEWIKPNKSGRVLGIIPWAQNGVYRFAVAGESNLPAMVEMIHKASAIISDQPDLPVDEFVHRLTKFELK